MGSGWNAWYHVGCNTFGTWLRGDPRGWRERQHRRHVEGDYKRRPTPGTGRDELALSKALMDRDAVRLTAQLRRVALVALVAVVVTLVGDGVDVLIASLDDHHLHVLARFHDHETRRRLGWAKFHATKKVKEVLSAMQADGDAVGFDLRLEHGDGIWAKGSKAEPVRDRQPKNGLGSYHRPAEPPVGS